MASNRFAQRMYPRDSSAERAARAMLANNVCQQVLAMNQVRMHLEGARDAHDARRIVDRMLAAGQQQIDAIALGNGHA